MNKAFCLLSIFLLFSNIYSSDSLNIGKITTDELLKLGNDDANLEEPDKILELLKNARPNTPYLESVALSTRVERLNLLDQRFDLRFNTRSHREMVAERRYHNSILKNRQTYLAVQEKSESLEKFRLAINLLFSYRIYIEEKKLVAVQRDKVNVLEKMSTQLVDFSYRDLISAMDNLFEAQTNKNAAKRAFLLHNKELSEYTEKKDNLYTLDDSSIITVAEIEKIVAQLSQKNIQEHAFIKVLEDEKKTLEFRYNLERASNRRILDHLEARYNMGQTIEDGEASYSLGVSFNLPFISSSRLDEYERLTDVIEMESEITEMSETIFESISASVENLNLLVGQYKQYLERKQFLTSNDALNAYLSIDGVDPLTVLELKEMTISNTIDIQTVLSEIYAEYINLLYVSGAFYTFAGTNFLLTGTEF